MLSPVLYLFCSCNRLHVSVWQMNKIQIQIILNEININNLRCECSATTELSLIILNGHNIKFDQCTGTRLLNVINFIEFVNFWKVKFTNFLLCFAVKLEDLYAFSYNPLSEKLTRSAGWALFDIQSEYARMGLPNSEWCCSTLNKDYKVGNIFNIRISAQPRISACPQPYPSPCFHSNSNKRTPPRYSKF